MRKIIFLYLIIIVSYSFIFVLLFRLPIEKYQPVLFYRGLLFLLIITFTYLVVVAFANLKKFVNKESIVAAVFISFALNLSFFVVFPVTFERSVTMYLLNTLKNTPASNQCNGLSKTELEQKMIDEYILDDDALGKRIMEQQEIDFINSDGNCIGITNNTVLFLKFAEIIKRIYAIKDS